MDFEDIINLVPQLFKYFVPGAIGLRFFYFMRNSNKDNYEYFIFKSIIVSSLIEYPLEKVEFIKDKDFTLFAIATLLGIIIAYLLDKILICIHVQKLLTILHIRKSTNNSIWDDVINLDNGSYVEVVFKDDDNHYIGKVEYVDDVERGDLYMSIVEYFVKTPDGKKVRQSSNMRLVFNTANAERLIFTKEIPQ